MEPSKAQGPRQGPEGLPRSKVVPPGKAEDWGQWEGIKNTLPAVITDGPNSLHSWALTVSQVLFRGLHTYQLFNLHNHPKR